jgi:hypothetical protein
MRNFNNGRAMFTRNGVPLYSGYPHAEFIYRECPFDFSNVTAEAPPEVKPATPVKPTIARAKLLKPVSRKKTSPDEDDDYFPEITSSDYELGEKVRICTDADAKRVSDAMYFLQFRGESGYQGAHCQRIKYEHELLTRLDESGPFEVTLDWL